MQPEDIVNSRADFALFLDQRLGLSKRTIAAYTSDARSFARFLLHERKEPTPPPDQSDHHLIARFVAWLKTDRRNGPATIRRKLISLKAYFRWSTERGLVGCSPFENERIAIRLPKRLPRALSRSDTIRLLHSLSSPSETDLALRLLLATGMRIGEMCAIDACDVATDGSALRIQGKGDRERTAFVANPLLQRHLALLTASRLSTLGPHAPLFLNRRHTRLSPQAFRLRLHRLAAQSGLPTRITPHRLRHTAATLLIEEGVDIRFVQKLLGHASIATTELYTKVVDASLRAALTKADPLARLRR